LTLFVVRVLLRFVSFDRWRRRLAAEDGSSASSAESTEKESAPISAIQPIVAEIAWAVDRISRRMPEQLACLPRGLAVCEMLRRRGIAATLEIGVSRNESKRFIAHAWVVHRGNVIIGAVPNLDRYAKLSAMSMDARARAAAGREVASGPREKD
jgi:hypothetical protein